MESVQGVAVVKTVSHRFHRRHNEVDTLEFGALKMTQEQNGVLVFLRCHFKHHSHCSFSIVYTAHAFLPMKFLTGSA